MIFTKLKYKNILSTGNIFTEINLNEHKKTLIVGSNGAGKSTILDAISFVLFNKPFRPDFNKPQLINSITRKDMLVEIEFTVGKKSYKIIRGIKPAIFEVYQNKRLLNQDANVRDYQDYLEKNILKCNHKAFCQVVILGSANYVPFMRLPAQLRREIVESILDLQLFSLMNSILATKKQQNEMLISDNVSEKKLLSQRIELIQQHSDQMNETNSKNIEYKLDRIRETNNDISDVEAEIVQSRFHITDIGNLITDAPKKEKLSKEMSQLKYKLENKISNLNNMIGFFHDNESCPTCSQEIDDDFKCNIVLQKKTQMNETESALEQLNDKIETVSKRLESIDASRNEISSLQLSIHQKENSIKQWKKYINELQAEVKQLTNHIKKTDKGELVKLNEQLSDISLTHNRLVQRKNILDLAGLLLKDSGVKARIIKQYIPIINKLINKYLSQLDFFVNFTINENFEERILSRYRDEFTYGSFSEGEKFRINLAILFTWRSIAKLRNSINTNILFLDETLDSSLDVSGTEEFLKIINTADAQNIFVISHKIDQLQDKFQNVIRFEKHHNFSRIAKSS